MHLSKTCSAKALDADELECTVKEKIKEWLTNLDIKKTADQIISLSGTADKNAERAAELAELDKSIANLSMALERMFIEEIFARITQLKKRRMEIEREIAFSNNINIDRDKIIEQLKATTASPKEKELLKKFVKMIYAQPDGMVTIELGVNTTGCGGGI